VNPLASFTGPAAGGGGLLTSSTDTVPYVVSCASTRCWDSSASRSDSWALICSWTLSRLLTEPARARSLRSWAIPALAEATRLVTSATVWVMSRACRDSEILVPRRADSAASVAWYRATGILSWMRIVPSAGFRRLNRAVSPDT
jgi:hypothetical protein